ncbi:hypothetical protein GF340_03230 [Candidatus Peregrinibacteria bacterium]|nr:hypothetical protein [Candidatus Peregrinibacteria bacterium]
MAKKNPKNCTDQNCDHEKDADCKKKGGHGLLLTLALGAALAAGAGYYATHKEQVDTAAKKKFNQLAKMYRETKSRVEKRVKEVWGEVSDETVATYMDLRSAILQSLEKENLKKTSAAVQKKYLKAVDDVLERARKAKWVDKKMEKKLESIFKGDWDEIKVILGDIAEEAGKGAQKAAENVGKYAKKQGSNLSRAAKKSSGKSVKKKAPRKK